MARGLGSSGDRDLHALDATRERIAMRAVVFRNRRASILADVATVVCRENHRGRRIDFTFTDLVAIDVQRDVGALPQSAARVVELHAHLMIARRYRRTGFDIEMRDAEQVVAILQFAALRVEAPAADIASLSDDH